MNEPPCLFLSPILSSCSVSNVASSSSLNGTVLKLRVGGRREVEAAPDHQRRPTAGLPDLPGVGDACGLLGVGA